MRYRTGGSGRDVSHHGSETESVMIPTGGMRGRKCTDLFFSH